MLEQVLIITALLFFVLMLVFSVRARAIFFESILHPFRRVRLHFDDKRVEVELEKHKAV